MKDSISIDKFDFSSVFGSKEIEQRPSDDGVLETLEEKEVVVDPFSSQDFSLKSPDDFKPKSDELAIDNDDALSYEVAEEKFSDRYNEVNEDLIGTKKGIPEGYPRIEFIINEDEPMTNREMKSLKHFLLGFDYVDKIEKQGLIRVMLKINTPTGIKDNYVGLISPKSLKTVLNNMKHHETVALFNEQMELKGKNIFALYVPNS